MARKNKFRSCVADAARKGGSARDVLSRAVDERVQFEDDPFSAFTSAKPKNAFSAVDNPPIAKTPTGTD